MERTGDGYIVERVGDVVIFTIDRPERHNSLTWAVRNGLMRTIDEAERAGDCKALIITGSGNKVFCSGGDLDTFVEELDRFDETWPAECIEHMKIIGGIVQKLTWSSLVVISAVNGAAFGGGCCLALAADIVVAAPHARFGFGFVKRGILPDWGGFYSLPRLVGMARAKNLMLRGMTVTAEEAVAMGMIAEVADANALDKARTVADEIAAGPKVAVSLTKNVLGRSFETSLDGLLAYEWLGQTIARRTEDHREGIMSFLEKRDPMFRGR